MVTIHDAIEAVARDLQARGEEYTRISSPEEVRHCVDYLLPFNGKERVRANVYLVDYYIPWVMEEERIATFVDSETGEVLARLGPANYSD